MSCSKIILIPGLFFAVLSFGQRVDKTLVHQIYNDFPLDSSINFIETYCKENGYLMKQNIYDSSKIGFSKGSLPVVFFTFKPVEVSINWYYAYNYALLDTIPKETLMTFLILNYKDSIISDAGKEFKELIKRSIKAYRHSGKVYIIAPEHGREGEMYSFYLSKYARLPMLTIELVYEQDSFFGKSSSIEINYIRPYAKTMSDD